MAGTDKLYYIKTYDAEAVILKQFMWSFITVRIPRDRIASVRVTPGYIALQTTGGQGYKVATGVRQDVKRKTREAFPELVGF